MTGWLPFLFGKEETAVRSETWSSGLVVLHGVADAVIALSLILIPAGLLYLYRRREDNNPRETALMKLFVLFILAVGLVHLVSLFTLWTPVQGLEGLLKAGAALLALTAAIVLWRATPHLMQLPSRDRLQAEIAAHLRTFEELKDARTLLEERVEARTKELAEAKQRFEIALRGSPITVFSQDEQMRFTWTHNLPTGFTPEQVIGKTRSLSGPGSAGHPCPGGGGRPIWAVSTGEDGVVPPVRSD